MRGIGAMRQHMRYGGRGTFVAKKSYPTEAAAEAAAKKASVFGLRWYQCALCSNWHIGHPSKENR